MEALIDPTEFTQEDMVLLTFSQNARGLFNFFTALRTKSGWGHVMIMHEPRLFASQTLTGYKEVPLEKYRKKGVTLKFWRVKGLTEQQKNEFDCRIKEGLKAPWWKRRYDFLGILGQLIGVQKLNSPWSKYCSERVAECLSFVKESVPVHPSPEDLDWLFESRPDDFEVVGYWIGE